MQKSLWQRLPEQFFVNESGQVFNETGTFLFELPECGSMKRLNALVECGAVVDLGGDLIAHALIVRKYRKL